MEVSDSWCDKKPAIDLNGFMFNLGAGQMEQPVKNRVRKVLTPSAKNNRLPGKIDDRPP